MSRIGILALVVLLAGLVEGAEEKCSTTCAAVFRPVCGTDGKTYTNKCTLDMVNCKRKTNTKVAHKGACKAQKPECNKECSFGGICELIKGKPRCDCSRDCPMIYQPVCGSDGESYANTCDLEVGRCDKQKNIRVVHKGLCKPDQPTKLCDSVKCKFGGKCELVNGKPKCACNNRCPFLRWPVCGSDGKTYPNSCVLDSSRCEQQRDIRLVHEGECKPGQKPGQPTKLCGSVKCEFGAKCILVKEKPKCFCENVCPVLRRPVCGNDGRTYDNWCELDVARCQQRKDIKKVHDGKCKPGQPTKLCDSVNCKFGGKCKLVNGKPKCACNHFCPLLLRPVCGSDGKTYPNWCVLENARCKEQKDIRLVHEGKCKPDQPTKLCDSIKCKFGAKCVLVKGKPKCECGRLCPMNYWPVCGSDGKTYPNSCALEGSRCEQQKDIRLVHEGKCKPGQPTKLCDSVKCKFGGKCKLVNGKPKCVCDRACPKLLSPVCGSDGKTYDNWCQLDVARCQQRKDIKKVHDGKCKPGQPTKLCDSVKCKFGGRCILANGKPKCVCARPCPLLLRPVCGSDGKTYPNSCVLEVNRCDQKKDIRLVHKGECKPDQPTKLCDSVKCNYGAKCELINGKPKCECKRSCPLLLWPVCGSDGKTYDSYCWLARARCREQKNITLAHVGKCNPGQPTNLCDSVKCNFGAKCEFVGGKPKCRCERWCPETLKPVCGSDGKTYDNRCRLEKARCGEQKDIRVAHEGKCRSKPTSEPNKCDMSCRYSAYKPVCGSNDKTYSSKCELNRQNCIKGTKIKMVHSGKCGLDCRHSKCDYGSECIDTGKEFQCRCTMSCHEARFPVCGSNGKTYLNLCKLEKENCEKKTRIKVVRKGDCIRSSGGMRPPKPLPSPSRFTPW